MRELFEWLTSYPDVGELRLHPRLLAAYESLGFEIGAVAELGRGGKLPNPERFFRSSGIHINGMCATPDTSLDPLTVELRNLAGERVALVHLAELGTEV